MMKSLLQGKPFGHPVHPALVHFPIGLFILSLVLDIFSAGYDDSLLTQVASYAMLGGVVMALLAALPGLVDYLDIRNDHPAKKKATLHMLLNVAAVVVFIVNLLLRYNSTVEQGTPALPLVLSFVGVGIILFSGYLGGGLVYNDGISVGRHHRHTDTPDTTISPNQTPTDGYVAIAPLDQLEAGSTLRAEVNGHIMTIARVGNEVYAFQEFCTHRFGPLSEGTFHGNNIVCPWHHSCFDVRTGKVTQGPAKIDLRVYETRITDGQITVRVLDNELLDTQPTETECADSAKASH